MRLAPNILYKSARIRRLAAIIKSVEANSRLKTWTDYVNGSPTPLMWPSIKQKLVFSGKHYLPNYTHEAHTLISTSLHAVHVLTGR